ncbi:MAG: hypothetical protein FJW24_00920 [Acidimicrobiia bacterium]|nr:hypothetical protein [Acidimicrobiia bacterium]
MDRIEQLAAVSVLRACGFGALAIFTAMIGAVALPAISAKVGAAATALMAAILLYKAINAPKQPYRTTELWIMLDKHHGLPEAHAQRILMGALRECYLRAAKIAFAVSFALWIIGFFFGLAGW